jgi:transcriptional regulator with XRE-family HTH domain
MPKDRPKVKVGQIIRSHRTARALSQGHVERRTGLLRCYISRVENGHTIPSLETLAKIAEAMHISLADFFPGADSPQDLETHKALAELSKQEIQFLSEIKKCTTTLSTEDKKLLLGVIRKMATDVPLPGSGKSVTFPRGVE